MKPKVLLAIMIVMVLTIGYFFGPFSSAKKGKVVEEVVFEPDAVAAPAHVGGTVRQLDDGTRIEVSEDGRTTKVFHPDGSETTSTNDGFGNSTQSRFYVDHTKVKGIAVFTAADGSRSVRVYGANGAVIPLDANALRDPLNATVSEIANAAGIFEEDIPNPSPEPVVVADEPVEAEPSKSPEKDGQ